MADSLFSMYDPQAFQQQRQAALNQQAMDFSKLSTKQQADMMGYQLGTDIGKGVGSLMGVEDQGLKQARIVAQVMKGVDMTDPEQVKKAAFDLGQQGAKQAGEQVYNRYLELTDKISTTAKKKTETTKIENASKQEEALRAELSKLPPNATDAEVEQVVLKYGDPAAIFKALENKNNSIQERNTKLQIEKEKQEAKAAENEKDRELKKAIAALGRANSDVQRELIQARIDKLKEPSPAQIKAQEKADKTEEGKVGVSETLDRARVLINTLDKSGGITSTDNGAISNLVTSAQTGTIGQTVGRVVGTKNQSSRDELSSLRLQLLNDVKQSTGMTGGQLNSNVELKTWLDSLGGPGMTKEANLNIINNIEKKYGKGTKSSQKGTKEDPIVLK